MDSRPRHKGRKLGVKVKGGGRCGERAAVCEELGDMKWSVSLMMLMMLIATMRRRCPRARIESRQNCIQIFQKNKGGRRGSEMWSWMWLVIPAPANTFLKKEGLQIAEASFRDYPPLANQKKAGRKAKPYRKRRTRRAGKRNRTEKGGLRVHMSCSKVLSYTKHHRAPLFSAVWAPHPWSH